MSHTGGAGVCGLLPLVIVNILLTKWVKAHRERLNWPRFFTLHIFCEPGKVFWYAFSETRARTTSPNMKEILAECQILTLSR